jgi:hypothetical protein
LARCLSSDVLSDVLGGMFYIAYYYVVLRDSQLIA